ncbi:hypothetical protein C2S51_017158 [Perilla frutescens var. frutescens]|nr:hypothetical protein C2S51_017158 [Perilla frutescens var. frutescens]
MNMVFLVSLFIYLLLCSTANCQETLQLLPLRPPPADELPPSAAVHVDAQYLKNVSDSILAAENWLRNHVLAHYPATNITTIVVGCTVLCNGHQQHNSAFILPSIKNLHHSLTRWGLQEEIKVSAAFSSDCLDPLSESYRADVAESYIKLLLNFLQGVSSPYVVQPPHHSLSSSEERFALQQSHSNAMKKLGVPKMNAMNLIVSNARRKLSNSRLNPFPPQPTPIAPAPVTHPAFAAGSPLPPLVGFLPPQPNPHAPPPLLSQLAPMASPPSPFGPHLPPCDPSRSAGAPAHHGHGHGAWCVAKPSVPADTLQEALDYACGEGSADCEAIKQDGSCYYPDTVVAHASYAFNSYWQKTKRDGGTCGFGGTAMLITSDPSYGHCRFALT